MSDEKESEKKEPKPEDGNKVGEKTNRWWEQYYVRYFVGTIVGIAVLMAVIDHSLFWEFRTLRVTGQSELWKEVAALTAAGLAYCYVASVPVLTLHAVRGVFDLNS